METEVEVRFTPDSLDYSDKVSDRICRRIRDLAFERTARSGRRLVTEQDMRACVQEAIQTTLRELGYDIQLRQGEAP
jgi:hypothetical protein